MPDDHPVREIAAVLDLSWVHSELAPYYPPGQNSEFVMFDVVYEDGGPLISLVYGETVALPQPKLLLAGILAILGPKEAGINEFSKDMGS